MTEREEKVNEFILRLVGTVNIPEPVKRGNDYKVSLEGSITDKHEKDRDDGTIDEIFTFRPHLGEIMDDKGKKIKAKDRRRNSQKLRAMIFYLYGESGDTRDFEEFYDAFMLKLLANFEGVVEYLKSVKYD